MSERRTIDEQDVARHARFLRGLAGSLVADPARADDAVQEAWLAALKRRPDATRPLEPWLARVVRNTLGRLRRGDARRAERERRSARPEAQPAGHDLAEKARQLRRLLDEVLTLPEAEREAVLLRWYEALPPREIAARLGVPVELVYRRLEHALARLRARYEARAGGAGAWRLGLVGVLGLPRELLGPTHAAALSTAGAVAGSVPSAAAAAAPTTGLTGVVVMATSTQSFLVAGACLAAGLGLGWLGRAELGVDAPPADSRPDVAGEASGAPLAHSDAARDPALQASEGAQLRARYEAALATLRERNASLEAEKAVWEQERARAKAAAAPFDPKALRFGLAGPTPAFDKADWSKLAGHVAAMNKILPQLRHDLEAGKDLAPEVTQQLQEHNTPLAVFAIASAEELKGSGPNGAYTHPAVIANLVRAALLAANDPLTPAQEQAIVALGQAWVADAQRAQDALPADAPALARTVAEVDAKQRFVDGVKGLLTASQRAVLFHPDTEGRLGVDLLSPALVYMVRSGVYDQGADGLALKLAASLLGSAGAKDADASAFLDVGRRWLDDLPWAATPRPMRDSENLFPSLTRLQECARAQLAAMQRLLEGGRLTAEQAAALRRATTLVTPQLLAPS